MIEINPQNFPSQKEFKRFSQNLANMEAHEEIIESTLKICKSIDDIEAIFLMGSLAKKNGDIFSDIDFYIILKDPRNYKKIHQGVLDKIDQIGAIIHIYESLAIKRDLIIYLKPYIKLELAIRSYEKMCKSWKVKESSKLLYDKSGLGKQIQLEAENIEFNFLRYEKEVKNMAISIPSLCYICAGYLVRGEIITSIDFIAWIRRNLMRITGFLLNQWDEGTRRAEQRFPTKIQKYYHKIKSDTVPQLWEALHILLTWYENALIPNLEKKGILHARTEVKPMHRILKDLENKANDSSFSPQEG